MSKINYLLTCIIILLLLCIGLYFYWKSDTKSPQQINFSQFVSLQAEDEYTIAKLTSHETFISRDNRQLSFLGKPLALGATEVTLSLTAHYKYFIPLSKLTHSLEGDVLKIHAPALQLAKPVAFEFSSVKESSNKSLLGPDDDAMMLQLKHHISDELVIKGLNQMSSVYRRAAESLADNLNNFIKANGNAGFYKIIEVTFDNDKGKSRYRFHYDNSFCQPGPCAFEMNLEEGKKLIIP